MSPRFVAFEGIDGAGKSTQAAILARDAAVLGITAIELEEPSRSAHGRRAREAISIDGIDLERQRELFTRDRRDQVERKVKPLLDLMRRHEGFMLVQSRYYLSAPAYQAHGEDEGELAALLAEQRAYAPAPDLFVVLDLPVDDAIQRIARSRPRDAVETPGRLAAVRRRYAKLRHLDPTPQLWVDAGASIDEVSARVREAVFREERG